MINLELKCSFKASALEKLSKHLPMSEKDKECIYHCRELMCIDYDGPREREYYYSCKR